MPASRAAAASMTIPWSTSGRSGNRAYCESCAISRRATSRAASFLASAAFSGCGDEARAPRARVGCASMASSMPAVLASARILRGERRWTSAPMRSRSPSMPASVAVRLPLAVQRGAAAISEGESSTSRVLMRGLLGLAAGRGSGLGDAVTIVPLAPCAIGMSPIMLRLCLPIEVSWLATPSHSSVRTCGRSSRSLHSVPGGVSRLCRPSSRRKSTSLNVLARSACGPIASHDGGRCACASSSSVSSRCACGDARRSAWCIGTSTAGAVGAVWAEVETETGSVW